jgi:hypothetical protein
MRRLIGLLALMAALGVFAVAASVASAEEPSPGIVVEPAHTSEMSPLSLSQCSEHTMCAWENNDFTGNFSQWPESSTGCHNHSGNPKLRSAWNRTGYIVRFGSLFIDPGQTLRILEGNPITGEICWPA